MIRPSSDRSPQPERRLPPRVLGKRKKTPTKAKGLPWYRHTAWFIPLVACVVFAVLIAGGLAVRQVIVLIRGEAPGDVGEGVTDQNGAAPPSVTGAAAGSRDKAPALLESSEADYEILPPKAAKEPGRKLRKMLLVGQHPEMFPTLEAAVAVAIPGDIVEIRTNAPLLVRNAIRAFDEQIKGAAITIRAGKGYDVVLRWTGAWMIELKNVHVRFSDIHFTAHPGGAAVRSANGSVAFERCSFTRTHAVQVRNELGLGNPLHVEFDRCLVRTGPTLACSGPDIHVRMNESAVAMGSPFAFDGPGSADNHSLMIRQSTFIHAYLLRFYLQDGFPTTPLEFRMEKSIFAILVCCPKLVHMHVPGPDLRNAKPDVGLKFFHDTFPRLFRTFDVADNLTGFWGGAWGEINYHSLTATPSPSDESRLFVAEGFPVEMPYNRNVLFNDKSRTHQAHVLGYKELKYDEMNALMAGTVPQDLVPHPDDFASQKLKAGVRYGCDPAKLPVPPPATLEPYQIPPPPDAKKN